LANAAAANRTFESIQIGEEAAFTRVITAADVDAFAAFSGDWNPLHMDAAYAATTPFGERVVHGMLVASLFSTLVGMYLPGRRALFLSQTVQFAKPIKIGEPIVVKGRVHRKIDAVQMIELETTASDEAGEVRIRGRAQVQVLT